MSETVPSRPRALVIGPAFFGYERDIVAELERQGYEAEFLDERPSNSSVTRAVVRVRPALITRRIDAHFKAADSQFAGRTYALVLVIKAEVVPRWFLESMRRRNPRAKFVFYTYDSLSNSPNCIQLFDCFDELWSFDRQDVEKHSRLSYQPLFFAPEFAVPARPNDSAPRRYSLSFIGTLHSERYEFVQKLFAGQTRTFGFFFVQARWYFALVKYLTRQHRRVAWREVSFKPMSRQDIAATFRESVAVLDMQRDGQSGLTMRTFEVLASGAILITTNAAITREPFYDPDRVLIVSADLSALESKAVQSRLAASTGNEGLPANFEEYSLESWVRAVTGRSHRLSPMPDRGVS